MVVFMQYLSDLLAQVMVEHVGSGGFSGPIYNANLVLYSVNMPINNGLTWPSFTEATYSGYARKTGVVFSAPILQNDGTYSIISNQYSFIVQAQSNPLANIIYGWALIDNSNPPNVLMAEQFAQPQNMGVPNAGFGLVISLNFGQPNQSSFGTVIA